VDTVYIHDMYFSHICHFRPMTQPNPTHGSTQPMDNSDLLYIYTVVIRIAFAHVLFGTTISRHHSQTNIVIAETGTMNNSW